MNMIGSATRRKVLRTGFCGFIAAACGGTAQGANVFEPRMRVISDNDYSGDPDGLFQLAHHVLSRSVSLQLVVGSHVQANDFWDRSAHQASNGAAKARKLLKLLGSRSTVVPGAESAIPSRARWKPSPATAAIVHEAMRDDLSTPLYYAAGGGLTELALAWLAEPRIGKRLKLVWIGGEEHPGIAPPPPGDRLPEYNVYIDLVAAQVLFNESDIEIWQVPRDAYRQMLFGLTELEELDQAGALGRFLKQEVDRALTAADAAPAKYRQMRGETYVMGDNPLVTLTALQAAFQPDPSSSEYKRLPTPEIDDSGMYRARPRGRPMRVYTRVDANLTFRDMIAKFKQWDATHPGASQRRS